jgi:hypothetical protein
MNIDIERLRARNDARRGGRSEAPPSPAEIDDLFRALDDVQEELRRMTEDRADLLASAELWADLYAASVDRANAAEAMLQRLADVPSDVQRYYALLDTIAVLSEAVENMVRECAECAGIHGGQIFERAREGRCDRCARALDALRATLEWRSSGARRP